MSEGTKAVTVSTISAQAAGELVTSAARKAAEIGIPMCIAVADHAGELKAFLRMDGAKLLAVGISQNKAYTAVSFGLSTDGWYDFIKEDGPLRTGIVQTPRLVVYGGGYPILEGGEVIGGIGVSGGHYTNDMEVAKAALADNGFSVA